jgi:hypothetical protein
MLKNIPQPALVIGAAGVIPFVAFAILAWVPAESVFRQLALQFQITYGALVLAFVGAVHWGLAIAGYGTGGPSGPVRWKHMLWSVVPSFLGFAAFFLTANLALYELAIGFAIAYFVDAGAARDCSAPEWYPRLRLPLSLVAIVMLVATALAAT